MPITLSPESTKRLHGSIKRYVSENLEQEIGDLKASMLLDFVLREIGPTIYNHAVSDVQKVMQERVADLDGVCYVEEFGYWKPDRKR